MNECYIIVPEGSGLSLKPCADEDGPLGHADSLPPTGYELAGRLGDPALLHCAVFRSIQGAGGFFAVHDAGGPLFTAVAKSNLAFAAGLGHFGRMLSYARYAADIFENMDDPDD